MSDHLCWGGAGGVHLHDLLPLPYTEAAVQWVAERARAVQDLLGVRFVLENVSSYLTFTRERDDASGSSSPPSPRRPTAASSST